MIRRPVFLTLLLTLSTVVPFAVSAKPKPGDSSEVKTHGVFSADKAKRGSVVQAAVIIDIPNGYHVNSNRPLSKFAIPTDLKVTAPRGVRSGAVAFPRSTVKTFSFSQEKLSVFENRAVLRFSVTVPADFKGDSIELHGRLRFQSCTDEVCFPPDSRDIRMRISVVDATESTKNINGGIFGGRRGH